MKLSIGALATLLPAVAYSQAMPLMPESPVMTVRGAFVALSVPDLDASARWYSEMFGLRPVMIVPVRQNGTRVYVLQGGQLIVELLQRDGARPLNVAAPSAKETEDVYGIVKAGFIVADFEKTLSTLRSKHAEIVIGPFPPRVEQQAQVIVRDNSGNLIQIFGDYAPRGTENPRP
jgi:methylmalonyl-CoA/ethylmalonyl-CoA epimerase